MTANSLKKQLLLWVLMPLVVVLILSALVSYYRALHFATSAYDHSLFRAALALADQVDVSQGQVVIDLPQVAKDLFEYDKDDVVYYRISAPNGQLILGQQALQAPSNLPASGQHLYYNTTLENEPVRVVAFALPLQNTNLQGDVLILVAETVSKREAMAQEIVKEMLITELMIALLAIALIWYGIHHGLQPLQDLKEALAQRSHRDLSALNTHTAPSEIHPLLHATNDLLARLREAIRLQQQFVADASHQLRTPLAGLKTQAELALRSAKLPQAKDHVALIHQSAERLSHLLSRLLSMASVDPAAGRNAKRTPLDLIALSRQVTSELLSKANDKQIDLGLDIQADSAQILGDEMMLREMLANLIDNAICYTPNQGMVTVTLKKITHQIELSIIDNGIGIPPAERQQVFERFHRLHDNEGNGCGLGLAIVKEVVLAHSANIRIEDGLPQATGAGLGTHFIVTFDDPA